MSGATFRPSDAVDFLVIGAGAAGGVMAKELSTAGFRVVVLEQGVRKLDSGAYELTPEMVEKLDEISDRFSKFLGRP